MHRSRPRAWLRGTPGLVPHFPGYQRHPRDPGGAKASLRPQYIRCAPVPWKGKKAQCQRRPDGGPGPGASPPAPSQGEAFHWVSRSRCGASWDPLAERGWLQKNGGIHTLRQFGVKSYPSCDVKAKTPGSSEVPSWVKCRRVGVFAPPPSLTQRPGCLTAQRTAEKPEARGGGAGRRPGVRDAHSWARVRAAPDSRVLRGPSAPCPWAFDRVPRSTRDYGGVARMPL